MLFVGGERHDLAEPIPALEQFADPRAAPWSPPTVELVMTPTDETASALWPERWPPWGDITIETDPSGRLHVYLPHTESGIIMSLFHANAPIGFGGRTWRVAVRRPIPNEKGHSLAGTLM